MAQQTTTAKKASGAKKSAAPKTPASKSTASKSKTGKLDALAPSADDRFRMIAEAAYLKAEQRGFEGDPTEHWLQAEAEVDAQFSSRH